MAPSAQTRKEIEGVVEEKLRGRVATKFKALTEVVNRPARAQAELAQAQARTEQRVEELAQAQTRTEEAVQKPTGRMDALEAAVQLFGRRLDALEGAVQLLAGRASGLEGAIGPLGARWGIYSEQAFRDAMKALLHGRYGVAVEERDIAGRQVDWVVRDGKPVLVQITSSTTRGDIQKLLKARNAYRKETGVEPDLMIVTAFISARLWEVARTEGIRIESHD